MSRCSSIPQTRHRPVQSPSCRLAEAGGLVLQLLWNVRGSSRTFSGTEQSCRAHTSSFQNIQQSYSSQGSVSGLRTDVASREWDRGPRNKSYVTGSFGKGAKSFSGARTVFPASGAGNPTSTRRMHLDPRLPPSRRSAQADRAPKRKH